MSAAAGAQKQTSQARIEANRRNAQKSTGPRTEEGKFRVSQNATTHGLTARHVVLDEESAEAFYTLRRKMLEDLAPEGEIECQLAEQMIAARWRILRLWETETDLYNKSMESNPETATRRRTAAFEQLDAEGKLQRLDRYEARLSREFDRALRRLRELQTARRQQRERKPATRRRPVEPVQHTDLLSADEYIRIERSKTAPEQNKPNPAPPRPHPSLAARAGTGRRA
ncbi:MAG: hypothetical protein IT160_08395 [Bryobacterales bacterium]|nr:hypothetical protein [Bryobacterales bacterium]